MHRHYIRCPHLNNREICVFVFSNQSCGNSATIAESDDDAFGAVDDMAVCEYVAVRCKEESGPAPLARALSTDRPMLYLYIDNRGRDRFCGGDDSLRIRIEQLKIGLR